jgi:hypothetical protein
MSRPRAPPTGPRLGSPLAHLWPTRWLACDRAKGESRQRGSPAAARALSEFHRANTGRRERFGTQWPLGRSRSHRPPPLPNRYRDRYPKGQPATPMILGGTPKPSGTGSILGTSAPIHPTCQVIPCLVTGPLPEGEVQCLIRTKDGTEWQSANHPEPFIARQMLPEITPAVCKESTHGC